MNLEFAGFHFKSCFWKVTIIAVYTFMKTYLNMTACFIIASKQLTSK